MAHALKILRKTLHVKSRERERERESEREREREKRGKWEKDGEEREK
jgi:hypothetical protein